MNNQEKALFEPLACEDSDIVPKKTLPSRTELIHFFQNYTTRAHSLIKSVKHSTSGEQETHPTTTNAGKYCEVQPHVYRFNFVLFLKVFFVQLFVVLIRTHNHASQPFLQKTSHTQRSLPKSNKVW